MKKKSIFSLIYLSIMFVLAAVGVSFSCGIVDVDHLSKILSFLFAQSVNIDATSFDVTTMFIGFGAVLLADVPVDDDLTAVAISYKNGKFIADEVLPYVQVSKQTFKYRKGDKAESYRIKDTKVGRTSAPNRVTTGWTEVAGITEDDGEDFPITKADMDNVKAEDQGRLMRNATETILADILLGRENRVATLVFGAGNYAAANKATLAGTDQFSHASSVPIKKILDAMDVPLLRPNVMVFGSATWSTFRQHASIVKATNRNSGDAGAAARQAVAELFEVDKVLVGMGRYSSAKKGLTPALVGLWGDFLALLYIPQNINELSADTFGFTARWGTRLSGQIPDPNIGLRGGVIIRAGESTKEVIAEADYGYLFSDCIA
jgi:hypothetical protein